MPTSLIIYTPGSATDNAYTDLDGADGYYANTLRTATWAGYSATQREQALRDATRDIEDLGGERQSVVSPRRLRFPGSPYYSASVTGAQVQSLHFPRSCDARTISGVVTLFIPADIVAAVCEQALWLLQQQASPGLIDHAALKAAGIASFSADGVAISYGARAKFTRPDGIAPQAWTKINGYIIRNRGTA